MFPLNFNRFLVTHFVVLQLPFLINQNLHDAIHEAQVKWKFLDCAGMAQAFNLNGLHVFERFERNKKMKWNVWQCLGIETIVHHRHIHAGSTLTVFTTYKSPFYSRKQHIASEWIVWPMCERRNEKHFGVAESIEWENERNNNGLTPTQWLGNSIREEEDEEVRSLCRTITTATNSSGSSNNTIQLCVVPTANGIKVPNRNGMKYIYSTYIRW